MRKSLRHRLLRYIFVPLAVGMLAIGVGSYRSARHEANKIYDAQMAHFAHLLMELMRPEAAEADWQGARRPLDASVPAIPYAKDLAYRVWLGHRLLLESDHEAVFGATIGEPGFDDRLVSGRRMRFFTLRDVDLVIEVAEDYHARTDLLHQIAISVLLPFFFILPLLGFAIWRGLRGGLKPLDQFSTYVSRLDPDSLERVDEQLDLPTELRPFVASINRLMQRVEAVIEREKRFTGYAAHELRTPLAALKTQLQVARREKDREQRQGIYEEALEGIDRMTHLVNQLLMLLRSQKGEQDMAMIDLSELVENALAHSESAMESADLRQVPDITPHVMVKGNADMLRVAVRNMLDNATRYSPRGAMVRVELAVPFPGEFTLGVHNSGVSVSPEECARLAEPFYRGRGNLASGAGLGLAIVSWVARMHQLDIAINCEGDGLTVQLTGPTGIHKN